MGKEKSKDNQSKYAESINFCHCTNLQVEMYLGKCVDSILHQTYRNLEVFLVDDGSPDKCPKVCTRARHSLAILAYTTNPAIVKKTCEENGWFKSDEITIME